MMQALDTVYRHELPDQVKQLRNQIEQLKLDLERTNMGKEDTRSKMVEVGISAYESEQNIREEGLSTYFRNWRFQLSGINKLLLYLLHDKVNRFWVVYP